jgi:hypothetical protein
MIFVADTEELTLSVFPDEATAVAHCKGIDVEAALCLFWDDAGMPVAAKFTVLLQCGFFSVTNGTYEFVHDSEFPQAPLLELLEDRKIKRVNGHPRSIR